MMIKTSCKILFISTLLISAPAFSQFTDLTPGIQGRVEDIVFSEANPRTGWAALAHGKLLKTIDGGLSWDTVLAAPELTFRCVDFINGQVGIASTLDSIVYRSTDAGNSWTALPDGTFPANFTGFCGLDHKNGVIYGAGYFDGSPYIGKSADLGLTWTVKDMSATVSGLVDVACIAPDTLLVSGHSNNFGQAVILKSTDGGESFSPVFQLPDTAALLTWKIYRVDQSPVFYASVQHILSGRLAIAKSTDYGNTWTVKEAGYDSTSIGIQGIGFLDAQHGFFGGHFWGYYETLDGGDNWIYHNDTTPSVQGFNRFYKTATDEIYAGGASIYYYGNSLGIQQHQPAAMTPVNVMQLFPNPASSRVTIALELAEHSIFSVSLFDAGGRFVRELMRANHPSGSYSHPVDIAALSPGIYYVCFISNSNFIRRKLVKL